MTKYRVVNINTDAVVMTFDDHFEAQDFCAGKGYLAIDIIEVDEDGFEVEDFDEEEWYEPEDIDSDFGFDPYEGMYTYDC